MSEFLIIGGGPAGTPAAMALAQADRKVTLVEEGPGLGGTCLFEGCIPSKIFRETARRLREIDESLDFGLCLPGTRPHLDWSAVQARKRAILQRRSQAALEHVRRFPTLELIQGRARLLSPRSAEIALSGGGQRRVEFEKAVIATGSVPVRPPIPGVENPRVLDSEGILDIDHVPADLVVIGGGPIGVELGQIFHAFGSRVLILEAASRLLGPVDPELSDRLRAHMEREGIEILTGSQVKAIVNTGGGAYVQYVTATGEPCQRHAENVLLVTGRHPRVEGLGLEHTRVRHGPHGIEVDAHLETAEAGIHALGDAVGQPMFAHWASAQALALARHLLGLPAAFPRPASNSAVIFSTPELGMVGLTEDQARAAGLDPAVARYDYAQDARAQIAGRDQGLLKILYDRRSRKVVGIHALVEGAADLMGEAALAVAAGIPIEALATAIHPHPTLTESFGLAARAALAAERPRSDG